LKSVWRDTNSKNGYKLNRDQMVTVKVMEGEGRWRTFGVADVGGLYALTGRKIVAHMVAAVSFFMMRMLDTILPRGKEEQWMVLPALEGSVSIGKMEDVGVVPAVVSPIVERKETEVLISVLTSLGGDATEVTHANLPMKRVEKRVLTSRMDDASAEKRVDFLMIT